MRKIVFLFSLLVFAGNLRAQNAQPMKPISGGILNGKAISLPKPEYPAIARAAEASGAVHVQITVDEAGEVISARAVSGHPLLQAAAVAAAQQAKFAPTKLSGQPVKITGVIVYNFVAVTTPDADAAASEAGIISGGMLNGKAVTLAKPEYPAAAREAGVGGAVKIKVVIDEEGKVVSAVAVSGEDLLHAVCVEAAFASSFSPTLLRGEPVKVSGYIIYNFAPTPKR